jgi:hypothetical protein
MISAPVARKRAMIFGYYALPNQEKPALEGGLNYSQRWEEISKGGLRTKVVVDFEREANKRKPDAMRSGSVIELAVSD